MRLRAFADVIAERQGGINLKPGRTYRKVLTREQVVKAFGEIPEYMVCYDLSISVKPLDGETFEVLVRRRRG